MYVGSGPIVVDAAAVALYVSRISGLTNQLSLRRSKLDLANEPFSCAGSKSQDPSATRGARQLELKVDARLEGATAIRHRVRSCVLFLPSTFRAAAVCRACRFRVAADLRESRPSGAPCIRRDARGNVPISASASAGDASVPASSSIARFHLFPELVVRNAEHRGVFDGGMRHQARPRSRRDKCSRRPK